MANKGKFKTLVHNGVVFPPDYEPKGYTLNGEKIPNTGDDSAEEMLWHYASKLGTEYVKAPVFNPNFYSCLKPTLTEGLKRLKFPEDFMPVLKQMVKDNEALKEKKAEYNKAHKADIEKEKEERKEKYGSAILDGKAQPVAYMVEGPGIFIARGEAPLLGMWKYRTRPEDITINYVGPKENEPPAPEGHKWGYIEHNRNAMHIAIYVVNIGNRTEKIKELRFGNSSDVKANADQKKFAKAAKLLCHMKEMEAHIRNGMESPDERRKQCALISWLIQTTGIRVGGEKNVALEADTVGASTLKKENIWYENGNLRLHFIGKDSVPYDNTISAPAYVGKAIERLRKNKNAGEQIFDVDATNVKDFLSECVDGCTPKLFRTAIASKLLVDAFKEQKVTKGMSIREKLHAFDMANLAVAKKLNHKKALPKNFDAQLEKLDTQIQAAIDKAEETTSKVEFNLKKIRSDIARANKNFEGDVLKTALKNLKEKEAKEKAKLAKAEEKVTALKEKRDFKGQTGDIAISTSRTNYCTPEIAYSICNDLDIPIEKIYTKTLREKFAWAKDTPKNYWRKYPEV
jgi:DNA topoisomerase-1